MTKIFLIVMACLAPAHVECKRMEFIAQPDPITCQLERVPVSGWWKTDIRNQGYPNWSIFTHCEAITITIQEEG